MSVPAIETCCHVPLPEYCLVGVIGDDRPHCARCRECGEMVEFERYDADGQQAIREAYADTVLAGPSLAPVDQFVYPAPYSRPAHRTSPTVIDTW